MLVVLQRLWFVVVFFSSSFFSMVHINHKNPSMPKLPPKTELGKQASILTIFYSKLNIDKFEIFLLLRPQLCRNISKIELFWKSKLIDHIYALANFYQFWSTTWITYQFSFRKEYKHSAPTFHYNRFIDDCSIVGVTRLFWSRAKIEDFFSAGII